jgi:hypothetical protein
VGKSALKIAVFYLRAICCNHIMWGVEGFEEISATEDLSVFAYTDAEFTFTER